MTRTAYRVELLGNYGEFVCMFSTPDVEDAKSLARGLRSKGGTVRIARVQLPVGEA